MSTPNRVTGLRTSSARAIPTPPNWATIPLWANGRASPFPAAPSRRPTPLPPKDDAEFATIPFEFPFAKLMQIIEEAVRDNLPLAVAIEELRRPAIPTCRASRLPSIRRVVAPGPARQWTPEQEKALAHIINIDQTRRVWMGSLEITELIRRRLAHEVTSPVTALTAFGISAPGISGSSPTSPFGGARGQGERFLVQRQCRTDHLRRDRAERESHPRRPRNQTALRRHVQLPLRTAGRKIRPARRRGFRGRHGRPRGGIEIQPRDRISWRCRRDAARPGAHSRRCRTTFDFPWTRPNAEP